MDEISIRYLFKNQRLITLPKETNEESENISKKSTSSDSKIVDKESNTALSHSEKTADKQPPKQIKKVFKAKRLAVIADSPTSIPDSQYELLEKILQSIGLGLDDSPVIDSGQFNNIEIESPGVLCFSRSLKSTLAPGAEFYDSAKIKGKKYLFSHSLEELEANRDYKIKLWGELKKNTV